MKEKLLFSLDKRQLKTWKWWMFLPKCVTRAGLIMCCIFTGSWHLVLWIMAELRHYSRHEICWPVISQCQLCRLLPKKMQPRLIVLECWVWCLRKWCPVVKACQNSAADVPHKNYITYIMWLTGRIKIKITIVKGLFVVHFFKFRTVL